MPTRSPLACGRSWRTAARGQEALPTFCVWVQTWRIIASRGAAEVGRAIPGHSPADCGVHRLFFARIHTGRENTVSTVSIVGDNDHDPGSRQPSPRPVGALRDNSHRTEIAAADD